MEVLLSVFFNWPVGKKSVCRFLSTHNIIKLAYLLIDSVLEFRKRYCFIFGLPWSEDKMAKTDNKGADRFHDSLRPF